MTCLHSQEFHRFNLEGDIWCSKCEKPLWKRLIWIYLLIMALAALTFVGSCGTAHAQEGFATYYTTASTKAEGNSGIWTASGERYDEKAFTCAMRRRDFGTKFLVYGQKTGKSSVITLTDFGPGRGPQKRGVIIDLSPTAFKSVCGDLSVGKCRVNVQEVL